jgi:TRAP transporter TAXI family solute receptor
LKEVKTMKRAWITLLVVCSVVYMGVGFQIQTVAAERVLLTLATGSPGGVYYPLGGGMAVVIQNTVKGFRCAAESTGASVENSRLVGNGDSDMGMVMGSVAYNAVHGKAPFKEKYDIVALFQMYPAPQHLVTTAQSRIKSISDLRGRRVSIDVPGSGCSTMAKIILEEAGFNLEKDLRTVYLSQTESVSALRDGRVDAAFFNFAFPGAAVMELAATLDIVLVPIEEKLADQIIKKHPHYVKIVIPGKTYADVDDDVLCLGDSNLMIAHRKMRDDVAYKIVRAIFTNVTEGKWALRNVHPVAAQLTPQNAVNSPIPLHPGAAKYFREVGALK